MSVSIPIGLTNTQEISTRIHDSVNEAIAQGAVRTYSFGPLDAESTKVQVSKFFPIGDALDLDDDGKNDTYAGTLNLSIFWSEAGKPKSGMGDDRVERTELIWVYQMQPDLSYDLSLFTANGERVTQDNLQEVLWEGLKASCREVEEGVYCGLSGNVLRFSVKELSGK